MEDTYTTVALNMCLFINFKSENKNSKTKEKNIDNLSVKSYYNWTLHLALRSHLGLLRLIVFILATIKSFSIKKRASKHILPLDIRCLRKFEMFSKKLKLVPSA